MAPKVAGWVVGTLALGGCGPTYGVGIHAEIDPAVWDFVGTEPATLFAQVADEDTVRTLAAVCPGDGVVVADIVRTGCIDELQITVWLTPDSEVPVADFAADSVAGTVADPFPPELTSAGCDPQRPLLRPVADFEGHGWPNAQLMVFRGEDGRDRLTKCTGWVQRFVTLY